MGVVLLAGPCLDETFGVVVLTADSEAAARAFMLNDPAVKNNVMMAELHPMKISVDERMLKLCVVAVSDCIRRHLTLIRSTTRSSRNSSISVDKLSGVFYRG